MSRCGRLTADSVPFLLAIEIKERSFATLDSVLALLQRHPLLHRESRPASDGRRAIEVVMVGWRPASPVASPIELAAQQRLVGWQHRISRRDTSALALPDPQVKLVSLDHGKTIGRWWVTAGQRRDWLATLRAVKSAAPGGLLRVHNLTPNAASYGALLRAGVDLIGTKELERTSRLLTELGNR